MVLNIKNVLEYENDEIKIILISEFSMIRFPTLIVVFLSVMDGTFTILFVKTVLKRILW